MPTVAVIGAAGSAGQRHCAAFKAEGLDIEPVEVGDYCPRTVDMMSIATPDHLHQQAICPALTLGMPVFCEKPLAHDDFSLSRIERVAKAAGVTFGCNLPLRFSHKLRGLDLSDLTYIAGAYGWGRKSKLAGWRSEVPDYSIVAGGGIHLIDLMLRIAGQPVTDIKATRKGLIVDATFGIGRALGHLLVDFSYEGRHEVNMVFGSARGHLPVWFDEPNDFRASVRDFLQSWRDGAPGNGLEALAANRACLAIERAAG